MASMTNGIMMPGIGVPGMLSLARSVQNSGNSVIAVVPSRPTAMPRNSASVPIVTASEGNPTTVMRNPLIVPATAPTRIAVPAAAGNGHPASVRMPVSTLVSPTMLATERSISSVMMMSVMGSAISRIGATSRSR